MPLKAGKSKGAHGANVREMMGSYDKDGKIGNVKPKNKRHALKVANAVAYKKGREAPY